MCQVFGNLVPENKAPEVRWNKARSRALAELRVNHSEKQKVAQRPAERSMRRRSSIALVKASVTPTGV